MQNYGFRKLPTHEIFARFPSVEIAHCVIAGTPHTPLKKSFSLVEPNLAVDLPHHTDSLEPDLGTCYAFEHPHFTRHDSSKLLMLRRKFCEEPCQC